MSVAANIFGRYVWLIEQFRRHGRLTYEEVNRLWQRSGLSYGEGDETLLRIRMAHSRYLEIKLQKTRGLPNPATLAKKIEKVMKALESIGGVGLSMRNYVRESLWEKPQENDREKQIELEDLRDNQYCAVKIVKGDTEVLCIFDNEDVESICKCSSAIVSDFSRLFQKVPDCVTLMSSYVGGLSTMEQIHQYYGLPKFGGSEALHGVEAEEFTWIYGEVGNIKESLKH